MTKNKNIDLIKNMGKTFEPTEKEHKEFQGRVKNIVAQQENCLLYTSPSPRDW